MGTEMADKKQKVHIPWKSALTNAGLVAASTGLGYGAGALAGKGLTQIPAVRDAWTSMTPGQRKAFKGVALGGLSTAAGTAAALHRMGGQARMQKEIRQKEQSEKTADAFAAAFVSEVEKIANRELSEMEKEAIVQAATKLLLKHAPEMMTEAGKAGPAGAVTGLVKDLGKKLTYTAGKPHKGVHSLAKRGVQHAGTRARLGNILQKNAPFTGQLAWQAAT